MIKADYSLLITSNDNKVSQDEIKKSTSSKDINKLTQELRETERIRYLWVLDNDGIIYKIVLNMDAEYNIIMGFNHKIDKAISCTKKYISTVQQYLYLE